MKPSIAAVILAGGTSSRMGQPKALLTLGSKSFLEHCVGEVALARIRDTIIVLGAGHSEIALTLGWFKGRIIVNHDWESGQLSSIVTGIDAITGHGADTSHCVVAGIDIVPESDHRGVLIWPVDHPLVSAQVISTMIRAFHDSGKPIVVPVYNGRRGHPIIFSSTLFHEVRLAPQGIGLRSVVRAHEEGICDVPTQDEGVIINIDTPDDYRRFVTMRAGNV